MAFIDYFPTKNFIKKFIRISFPIIIQQIFINSAIVVDHFMVGRLGQEAIMALGAINSIHFIFTFIMFGIAHGPGIFITQYNGAKNKGMLVKSFAIKQQLLFLYSIITILIILFFAPNMVAFFIKPSNSNAYNLAVNYYRVFAFSIFFKSQNYGCTTSFREIGLSKKGMLSSVSSVFVNIVANYFFIFGFGSWSGWGVVGAGLGTVLAKLSTTMMWHFVLDTSAISKNLLKAIFTFDKNLFKTIASKAIPLTFNEIFWAGSITLKFKELATFGPQELTAFSILRNMDMVVAIIWPALAGSVIYLVGKQLGSGNMKKALARAKHMVGSTVLVGLFITIFLIAIRPLFIGIYVINDEIFRLSNILVLILAITYPIAAITGTYFFILRTAGLIKTIVKIDLLNSWLIMLPVLYFAKYYMKLDLVGTLIATESTIIIKLLYIIYRFRKYDWLKTIIK